MDKYDNVTHFRLDKLLDCTELPSAAKQQRRVKGLEYGLRIPESMTGHAYMFTGKTELVRLRVKCGIVGDVLDWFGMDVRFENITEDSADAVVRADGGPMRYWLKQYDEFAERVMGV